jgi:RimJ/RimL family protein N-acetyltransferase
MVFVRPSVQRRVLASLVFRMVEAARSLGYHRVDVWTARENLPARRLYERAGMTLTGKVAPLRSSQQLQYESLLTGEEESRPEAAR